jgi:hypothetical protein
MRRIEVWRKEERSGGRKAMYSGIESKAGME